MDRTEEILREELKVDKAVGLGKLMWEVHKNTLKKCLQIYADEQLRLHSLVLQSEQLNDNKPCAKQEAGLGRCKEHCGKCEYIV